MNPLLRPYLAGSLVVHAAVLAPGLILLGAARLKPAASSFTVDFVGPSATLLAPAGSAPPSETAARPASSAGVPMPRAMQKAPAASRRHRRIALPRPSLLGGKDVSRVDEDSLASSRTSLAGASPEPETSAPTEAPPGSSSHAALPAGAGAAGIATDLPNFPYPWYISQVRLLLWQAWQKRMPRFASEGVASFLILRGGSITDLSMESSSGDPRFDRFAVEAVQTAAPFPPLPADFREPFLKIHLTLKSGEPE